MALSDIKVRNLKPRERDYKVADSEGLMVLVTTKGSLLWRMAYRFEGKQKQLSFGAYPLITLLEARRLRDDAKRLLAQGIDPNAVKQEQRQAVIEARTQSDEPVVETFKEVGQRWFNTNEKAWVSSYSIRLLNRLNADIYPDLGERPITAITGPEILETIRKIEARGSIEMASRVHDMVRRIFRFAKAEGTVENNPADDLVDALAPPPRVKHRTAIKAADLPGLISIIKEQPPKQVTPNALLLVIHTLVRTQELRFAEWHEFERLESSKPIWRIPESRMKIVDSEDDEREDHLIPLTPQAVEIIERLRKINGHSRWVFRTDSSRKDIPISGNAMLYYLYRHGYRGRATVHGFRTTASTILNEKGFNKDWVEMQLAHVDASIRGVYNAALYLAQRRQMMTWWSNFVDGKVQLSDQEYECPDEILDDEDDFADLL